MDVNLDRITDSKQLTDLFGSIADKAATGTLTSKDVEQMKYLNGKPNGDGTVTWDSLQVKLGGTAGTPASTAPKNSTNTASQAIAQSKTIDKELKTLEGELKVSTPDFSIRSRRTIYLKGLGKYLTGLYYVKGNSYKLDEGGISQSLTVLKNAFIDDLKPFLSHVIQPKPAVTEKPIVVKVPATPHKVAEGETLKSIAIKYSIGLIPLLNFNSQLFPVQKVPAQQSFYRGSFTENLPVVTLGRSTGIITPQLSKQPVGGKLVPGTEIMVPRSPVVKIQPLSTYRVRMDVLSKECTSEVLPEYAKAYNNWKYKKAPNDTEYDYDYQGYFNSGIPAPTKGLHWSDSYKKPNHPTFSVDSIYSTPEHTGGRWINNGSYATFRPSAWMKADPERVAELKRYFRKYEEPLGNKLYLEEE